MDERERKVMRDRAYALANKWIDEGHRVNIVKAIVQTEPPGRAALLVAMVASGNAAGGSRMLSAVVASRSSSSGASAPSTR